jgi:hypothetical protein
MVPEIGDHIPYAEKILADILNRKYKQPK